MVAEEDLLSQSATRDLAAASGPRQSGAVHSLSSARWARRGLVACLCLAAATAATLLALRSHVVGGIPSTTRGSSATAARNALSGGQGSGGASTAVGIVARRQSGDAIAGARAAAGLGRAAGAHGRGGLDHVATPRALTDPLGASRAQGVRRGDAPRSGVSAQAPIQTPWMAPRSPAGTAPQSAAAPSQLAADHAGVRAEFGFERRQS